MSEHTDFTTLFIYLFDSHSYRETGRAIFQPQMIHSPDGHIGWGWDGLKLGALFRPPTWVAGAKRLGHLSTAFPRPPEGSWMKSRTAGTQAVAQMGC